MTLTAGTTLQNGRYIIHSVVHRGDVDITYDATHTYLDQAVHIKTLQNRFRPQFEDVNLRQEFTQRAASFAQCTNPHLVRVLDGFEEDWMPFLVLKQIPGQSLDSLLQSRVEHGNSEGPSSAPYGTDEVLSILQQAVSAVQSLHDHHLIHGAIAPQTLLLRDETQDIVLMELGFRSLLPSLQDPDASWSLLSPGDDIRGLATTLYALLTGNLQDAQVLIQQPSFVELSQFHPTLYPALESVLIQGLNPGGGESVSRWFSQVEAVLNEQPYGQPLSPEAWDEAQVQAGLSDRSLSSPSSQPLPEQTALPQMPLPPAQPQPIHPSPLQASPSLTAASPLGGDRQTVATVVVSPAAAASQYAPRATTPVFKHQSSKSSSRVWRLPMALGLTSVVAALTGGYLGLSFRMQEVEQLEESPIFGNEIFGTEQTFPASDSWPGESDYDGRPSNLLFERANPSTDYNAPSDLDSQILASPELLAPETAEPAPDYTFQDDVQFSEPDSTWDWDSISPEGEVSPVAPAKEPPAAPVETTPPPVAPPPPSGSSGTVPPSAAPEPAPSPAPQVNEVPRSSEPEQMKAPAPVDGPSAG